ncbi:MAG: pseudaminic acid cytidylyltransferase [Lachnospiraceae bacterium]|nr:pseudaminic acid cytidylyltransferase [Lachnospiraceae bacterium]
MSIKKNIAIIPARGGSKRIPHKNIRDFLGKPIITYSISTALRCGFFDEVMVSTDSEEIAEIARSAGASVPFMRSAETSGDHATTEDVILEVLGEYKKAGREFDYVTCIYPTAVLTTPESVTEAVHVMEENEPAVVLPLIRYSYPPQRAFIIREDGSAAYENPEHARTRSQDLEPMYHDAGQFYVYNVKKLAATIEDDYYPIIVPEMDAQDIDNLSDWEMAEIKYRLKGSKKQDK